MENIKSWIAIYKKEDGGKLSDIICFLMAVVCISIRGELGFSLLLLYLIWNTYQIASLYERHGVEEILVGFPFYKSMYRYICKASVYGNVKIFCFMLCYLLLLCQGNIFLKIIYLISSFFFAINIGIFFERYIALQEYIWFILALLFFSFLPSTIFKELYMRYVSPTMQFSIMEQFSWINFLAIIGISIFLSVINLLRYDKWYKKGIVIIAYILFLCSLIGTEIKLKGKYANENVNQVQIEDRFTVNYQAVPYNYAAKVGKCTLDMLQKCESYGFDFEISGVTIYRSVYFPWESSEKRVPMRISEDKIVINCYTNSLCMLEREELAERFVNSLFDVKSELQQIMMDMYKPELVNTETEYAYKRFLYEGQIDVYQKIVSPRQMFMAEIMDHDPSAYANVFDLAEDCANLQELAQSLLEHGFWEKNEALYVLTQKIAEGEV